MVNEVAELLKHWGVQQAAPSLVEVRVEPQPVPADYPQSFAEFVGQGEVVRALEVEVAAVRRTGRQLKHILLYGPPGVGKTGLAYVLAGELGMTLYESSGAEFRNQDSIVLEGGPLQNIGLLWEQTRRPILWLIDEIDEMARAASYVLHPLMTHNYVTWGGVRHGGVPITILGTTNRMASVPSALRSRFKDRHFVGYYAPDELADIAKRTAERRGFALTEAAAAWVGENAAGEARKVNEMILTNVENIIASGGTAEVRDVVEALRLSGLRHRGLTGPQFDYLAFLAQMPERTAGLASVAGYLAQSVKDVQFEVEPFLIRSRYAVVARSGRQLTQQGIQYLAEAGAGIY